MPSATAQARLIQEALTNSQLQPDDISYVEAHGTGTTLGDPIEIRALTSVFGANRDTPLFVGSVKTNMGQKQTLSLY